MADGRIALAAEAFVYGFPLVFDLQEVDRFTRVGFDSVRSSASGAPRRSRDRRSDSCRANDTIYSAAQVDLGGGPCSPRFRTPPAGNYVLQFIDAWTNNFVYVDHRATVRPS